MENWGGNTTLAYKAARRLLICPTYNGSAALNRINKSSLVAGQLPLSVLQALYNTWWHSTDPDAKWAATPQVSEFTVTDVDPTESTSEWYKAIMQAGERDASLVINDPSPNTMKQLALLTSAGQISFAVITGDDYLLCKYDGTYLTPIQMQDGSLKVTSYKPRGFSEHSKNIISFRLNEADAMNSLVAVKITGGYVTSDSDHFSLINAVAVPSAMATGAVVLTITRAVNNPLTPSIAEPITGILFSEVVAHGTDVTDDETPALAANWVETAGGVYTWTEAATFTSGKTYQLKISHPRVEVADVSFLIP
jgi:hypothetical protein